MLVINLRWFLVQHVLHVDDNDSNSSKIANFKCV